MARPQINNAECSRCMHCISKMTKALRPTASGGDHLYRLQGSDRCRSLLSWVIVPFIKVEGPYTELKEVIRRSGNVDDNAKPRERIGEVIEMKA